MQKNNKLNAHMDTDRVLCTLSLGPFPNYDSLIAKMKEIGLPLQHKPDNPPIAALRNIDKLGMLQCDRVPPAFGRHDFLQYANMQLVNYHHIEDQILTILELAEQGFYTREPDDSADIPVHPIPSPVTNTSAVADLAEGILRRIGTLLELEERVNNGELVAPDDDSYIEEELITVKDRLATQIAATDSLRRELGRANETIAAHSGTIAKQQLQITEYRNKIDNLEANIAKMTSSNRVDDRTFGQLDRIVRSAPGSMKGNDDNG